jgi:hypothetical protein
MKIVTVLPVEGRLILTPESGFKDAVPAEGKQVFLDSFYARAINQGDLTTAPDTSLSAATPESAPTS